MPTSINDAKPAGEAVQHVFIIGSKSIGQYGGYETFVDRLSEQHRHEPAIQYHIACKANGDGHMDESGLQGVTDARTVDGVEEFNYHNAHVFKLRVPEVGAAQAILYDLAALRYSIAWCRKHDVSHPIFYVLACRIGPFLGGYKRKIAALGGRLLLNPDGHEWMRAKWPAPVRRYWKLSERAMVRLADLVVCDSLKIEEYIHREYAKYRPQTTYIAYGSDVTPSPLADDDERLVGWLRSKDLKPRGYYLVVGRFVPENNFETMLREFMASHSAHCLALITNVNDVLMNNLEERLHFSADPRIRFVGSVYDKDLLKKLRENAYGYLHGHEVGGTNPSLLEAMGSTKLNLLLDVGFNREVGQDAALYWTKESGALAALIDRADALSDAEVEAMGVKARARIQAAYSWAFIGEQYKRLWLGMVGE